MSITPSKRIAKNSMYIILGDVFSGIIIFVLNILIARYMGPSLFGDFSLIIAFVSIFSIIANFGIDTILIREISKNYSRKDKLISNSVVLKLIFSISAFLMSAIIAITLPYSFSVKLGIIILSLTLISNSFTYLFTTIFQSRLEMIYYFISIVAARLSLIGLVYYVFVNKGGFVQLIIAFTLSYIVQSVLTFIFSKRYIKLKVYFNKKLSKYLIKESWPLALSNIFISIYNRIDIVMLSFMKTSADIGFYSVAYIFTGAFTLIPLALTQSLFPFISNYFKKSKNSFKTISRLGFKYLIMVALPLAAGVTFLSKDIILFFFNSSYLPSAAAIAILIWSTFFIFINYPLEIILVSINKQRVKAYINGVGVIINVILNFILIPLLSFIGAALATVFTELVSSIILYLNIPRNIKLFPTKNFIKMIIGTLIMLLFLVYSNLHLIIEIIIAMVVYFIVLVLSRVFSKEELIMFKNITKKS